MRPQKYWSSSKLFESKCLVVMGVKTMKDEKGYEDKKSH